MVSYCFIQHVVNKNLIHASVSASTEIVLLLLLLFLKSLHGDGVLVSALCEQEDKLNGEHHSALM